MIDRWVMSLRAANRSPATIRTYRAGLSDYTRWLTANGATLETATSDHVDAWLADLVTSRRPATARVRHAAVRAFYRWAVTADVLAADPTVTIRSPKVVDPLVPIVSDRVVRLLLDDCTQTGDLTGVRDGAMIRVLIDTGMRASELVGIRVGDIEDGTVVVSAKGRVRRVHLSMSTVDAIDRWLIVRQAHRFGGLPWLWLGARGRYTVAGLAQMLRTRSARAGVDPVHPHQFRHSAAAWWKGAGGSDAVLMAQFGWSSPVMLARYGRVVAEQQSIEAHGRLAPGDRFGD